MRRRREVDSQAEKDAAEHPRQAWQAGRQGGESAGKGQHDCLVPCRKLHPLPPPLPFSERLTAWLLSTLDQLSPSWKSHVCTNMLSIPTTITFLQCFDLSRCRLYIRVCVCVCAFVWKGVRDTHREEEAVFKISQFYLAPNHRCLSGLCNDMFGAWISRATSCLTTIFSPGRAFNTLKILWNTMWKLK